jgi:hypothetical protein
MPVDYANGKIYKIVCNITGDVYYGSTTQALSRRIGKHRSEYKTWLKCGRGNVTSYKIIARGDYDICLVEKVICESKEELHQKERSWIESNDCVNRYIPGRTKSEWREANREGISEKKKAYYEANREKQKVWYEANREKIATRDGAKVQCGCGTTHNYGNKARHAKSKKHQKWLTSSTNHSQRCP